MGQEYGARPPQVIELKDLAIYKELLTVSNSGVVCLQTIPDENDGLLYVGQKGTHMEYSMDRFFFIDKLSAPGAIRGKHAHRELKQIIFSVRGEFTLLLDDGKNKQKIRMNVPNVGIRLDGLLWHDMVDFTPDCLIYVAADEIYNEADYVRDYDEYKRLVSAPGSQE